MNPKSNKYSNLHIIIDAADGLGKTTVCEMLSKMLELPIIKMKDMPKHFKNKPEQASEVFNKTIIQFKDFGFIQDRGWPSSYVYTFAFGRDPEDVQYIKSEIVGKLNEVVFLLHGDRPFRGDDIIPSNRWQEINAAYTMLETIGDTKVHHINVTGLTPEDVCKQIINLI